MQASPTRDLTVGLFVLAGLAALAYRAATSGNPPVATAVHAAN